MDEPNIIPVGESPPGDNQQGRPRFAIRDMQYINQPQEPVEYLVEGLIARGSVTLWFGDSGAKKSYAALSLGVCVASGKDWLSFSTKKARVLFVDEESGDRRMRNRSWLTARGELPGESTDQLPFEYVTMAGWLLDDPTDAVLFQALIEKSGAELVVIDALCDVMVGDENSKKDTQPVFRNLRKIADELNVAIIVIHHSNKAGGYRGSSAIKAAVDNMTKITSPEGGQFINFAGEKFRDLDPIKWAAKAVWTDDQFYLEAAEVTGGVAKLSNSKRYVLKYLQDNGPSLVKTIADNAEGCSASAAKRAVFDLAADGQLMRTNSGYEAEYAIAQPICEL